MSGARHKHRLRAIPVGEPEPEPTIRYSWDQPICEADWIGREATYDGVTLVSVRQPVRTTETVIEQCAWCGKPTIMGIYVRADPKSVPFPAVKREA